LNFFFYKATSHWDSNGICINFNQDNINEEAICLQYKNHFQVVFVDVHTTLNLCHHITIDLYERLKHDATLTLAQFNDLQVDILHIFTSRIEFQFYFDHFIKYDIFFLLITTNYRFLFMRLQHLT